MAVFRQYCVIYINKHRDESVNDAASIIAHFRACKAMEEQGMTCYRYKSDVREYIVDAANQNEARAKAFQLLIEDLAEGTGKKDNSLYFEHDWKVGAIERSQATSGTVSKEDNVAIRAKMATDTENREVARKAKRRRAHRAKKRTINGAAPSLKTKDGRTITTTCKTKKLGAELGAA